MQADIMRAVAIPLLLIGLAGCRPQYVGNDGVSTRPPAPRVPTNPRPGRTPAVTDSATVVGLSSKPVSSKEAPVTLFARDGSSCTVSESRFREIIVGQQVRCGWR
jgi:hypothetical protein